MKRVVGIADMKLSSQAEDVLVTYALGSCLGITLYDPVARVGGLLHVMLPMSKLDPARAEQNPFVFVDTGLPRLLREVMTLGARRERLTVRVAGGAHTHGNADNDLFQIGKRNVVILQNLARNLGLTQIRYDVGGTQARTMSISLTTGVVELRSGGDTWEL